MGRWEPGAAGRLREAALDLFAERGFEQTMVSDIAERAGVTARTFFRHFADKREVLFDAAGELEEKSLAALAAAPPAASALEVVAAALDAVADVVGQERAHARKRHAVISANAELRERELDKLARLSAEFAGVLRARGIAGDEADLAAEVGIAVYRFAYRRWVETDDDSGLTDAFREGFAQLRALAVQGAGPGGVRP